MEVLESINLFKLNFYLNYKGKEDYSTSIGIILSIISYLIGIFSIFYFSFQTLDKNNYNINSYKTYSENDNTINMTNLPLVLGIYNSNNLIEIDESYFTFNVIKEKYNLYNFFYEYENIELIKCNSSLVDNDIINQLPYENISKLLCFPKNIDLSVYGHPNTLNNNISKITINLSLCNNENYNNQCKDKDTIYNLLKNSYIIFSFINYNAEHNDYKNPIKKIIFIEYFNLINDFINQYTLYFSPSTYYSYNGIIFDNKKYIIFMNFIIQM